MSDSNHHRFYMCCVLTISLERNTSDLIGVNFKYSFFSSGKHNPHNTMGWTYKYCTVLNEMLCESHHSRSPIKRSITPVCSPVNQPTSRCTVIRTDDATHSLSMWKGNGSTTSLQNKLVTIDKVYTSKHARQSQWHTKLSSETPMEWQIAFS